MLKHLKREYYNKAKNFKIVIGVILIIFASFIFGLAGGIIAPQLNSDFFNWIGNSLQGEDILAQQQISEKVIKALVEEDAAAVKAVGKVFNSTVSIVISKDLSDYYSQTGPYILPFEFYTEPKQDGEPTIPQKTEIGGGSGFIISRDGLILTNKHVVSDANAEYSVILSDGTKYEAKVLAIDPLMDLAVLKIDATNLPEAVFGDSDTLALGQTVIAIGYSLSRYQNSVTKGIVSGTARHISAEGETIDEAIQTDAAINPGNSGGPLINLKGEVIGINTAINLEGQLIGFAIPSNSAKQVVESVKKFGKIVRPWIGVRYIILNEQISADNNFPSNYGALLLKGSLPTDLAVIPSSPADKAGLEEGDIILEIGGAKITENSSLAKMISRYDVGDTVILKILRKGEDMNVSVNLEEYGKKN
ncbi:trypsin-like peptidase domain-containing protein [Candidatus Parcubacteria bacterium]|nr:trypsin-like peptidase domain-containing protein [Patescibacteria group bacterium]MCG2694247.1 trypsin-like peptidase domain-containing protein [Candidatus Parcubacteria bacterium]